MKKYSDGCYTVIGPAPAPVSRLKNKYRWQVLLKVNIQKDGAGKILRKHLRSVLNSPEISKKATNTLSIDVDPISMM